ncbi:energy transducer TonB [Zeaxanthinibacter sp. PT1]|uniref:energy transducer TonB n=1 Tax=Zeaxanthinibacter TaxID=561554 RepID=UPI00234BD49B|nr:energy transducer TonB [Zeaxanthinibacter sp. PT1]MDC6351326.1 energy transducer TonB [Zeaxanthinibacter sp. PT1]
MQVKKNPRADLDRYSGLYFVIGLAIVLFTVWRALEYKSYKTVQNEIVMSYLEKSDLDEEVPITKSIKLPPPPVMPAAPAVIEIVEDTKEIEETLILSTETDQEAAVAERVMTVDEVVVDEEEEEITVPFAVIEDVPVFPGCAQGTKDEIRQCFQDQIQLHVRKHFKYPPIAAEMEIQGRVYVQFVINTEGYVTDIRSRGPDKLLEKEAERIIASLPRMTPGKQRGRPVKVPYSIPINFKLL